MHRLESLPSPQSSRPPRLVLSNAVVEERSRRRPGAEPADQVLELVASLSCFEVGLPPAAQGDLQRRSIASDVVEFLESRQ